MDIPWPSTSDEWQAFASVGTWAAVTVALVALAAERISRWRELRDRQAAQARMLLVDEGTRVISSLALTVRFTNHSTEPFLGVTLEDVVYTLEGHPSAAWERPGTMTPNPIESDIVASGETFEVVVEFYSTVDSITPMSIGKGTFVAKFTYTDARGLRWSRTASNQPVRFIDRRPSLLFRGRTRRLRQPQRGATIPATGAVDPSR